MEEVLSYPLSTIGLIFQPNPEWLEFVENHEPLECRFLHKMFPTFFLQILYHCWLGFVWKTIGIAVAFASSKYFISRLGVQRCYINICSMMISHVHGPCVLLGTTQGQLRKSIKSISKRDVDVGD